MIITKSVKQIIIINFIVFAVTYLLSLSGFYLNNILALFPIYSDYFHPLQLITHLFAHANFNHVFFNMLFLFLFGSDVEKYFGYKNFWILYLTGGLIGSLFYFLIANFPVIGASGAVFTIISSYIFVNYKNTSSINLKSILVFIIIMSEIYSLFIPITDNIGHFAHVIGAVYGFFFFLISRNRIELNNI